MALTSYVRNMFGSVQFGDLSMIVIQATVAGGAGVATRDAANSSPDTTIARNAAGQYTVTFPLCQTAHPLGAETILAEQLGSKGYFETLVPSTGTATIEFAKVPGTAAEVEDTTRICITILVGQN